MMMTILTSWKLTSDLLLLLLVSCSTRTLMAVEGCWTRGHTVRPSIQQIKGPGFESRPRVRVEVPGSNFTIPGSNRGPGLEFCCPGFESMSRVRTLRSRVRIEVPGSNFEVTGSNRGSGFEFLSLGSNRGPRLEFWGHGFVSRSRVRILRPQVRIRHHPHWTWYTLQNHCAIM